MKKYFALLLALLMVISLVGCSQEGSQPVVENTPADTPNAAPAEEVSAKDPVTIRYYFMNGAGEQQYTTQVEEKLNEILRGIDGYEHISMDLVPCNDYATEFILDQTSGAQIDLVSTYGLDMTTMVNNGDFLELSDLLSAYPNVTSEVPEWLVPMGKLFDGMYFVPTYQQACSPMFMMMPTTYVDMYCDATGKTRDDIARIQANGTVTEKLDFLEEFTLAVREGTGLDSKYIHFSTTQSRMFNSEYIGVDYGNILLVEGDSAPVYWPTSDVWYEISARGNEWYKSGLIHPDAATYKSSDYGQKNLLNEESFAISYEQDATSAENLAKRCSEQYGFDVEIYPICDHAYIPSKWAAGGNAIYTDCAHPEEAMMIIELLMTEKGEEFYNTLVWGLEGIHWEWEDQATKRIRTLEYDASQGDATSSYCAWKWNIGNTFNVWNNQAVEDGYNEYLENEIHNAPSTVSSPVTGITWDLSTIEDQIAQCKAVDAEYNGIQYLDNFEELYQEYMDKLEAAGVQDIIACLTEQYNNFIN